MHVFLIFGPLDQFIVEIQYRFLIIVPTNQVVCNIVLEFFVIFQDIENRIIDEAGIRIQIDIRSEPAVTCCIYFLKSFSADFNEY